MSTRTILVVLALCCTSSHVLADREEHMDMLKSALALCNPALQKLVQGCSRATKIDALEFCEDSAIKGEANKQVTLATPNCAIAIRTTTDSSNQQETTMSVPDTDMFGTNMLFNMLDNRTQPVIGFPLKDFIDQDCSSLVIRYTHQGCVLTASEFTQCNSPLTEWKMNILQMSDARTGGTSSCSAEQLADFYKDDATPVTDDPEKVVALPAEVGDDGTSETAAEEEGFEVETIDPTSAQQTSVLSLTCLALACALALVLA